MGFTSLLLRRPRWRPVLIGLSGGAGLALIAAGVYASIPAPNGVINGCYQTASGKLRVIDSAATCRADETALNWNQMGTQGPAGPQGPAGAPGTALGFAHVLSNGTVVAADSKNVTTSNISRTQQGSYCFNGLTFTPKSVVVTQEATQNPAFVRADVNIQFGFTGCANAVNQAAVIFNEPNATLTLVDSSFFIVFN